MVHTATPEDKHKCPKCGSNHIDGVYDAGKLLLYCLDCGYDETESKN